MENMPHGKLKDRITWARVRLGLTQQELANKSKIAQSTIASWETGARETGRKIPALAEFLGVDPLWLAEGKGAPFASTQASQNQFDQNVRPSPLGTRAIPVISAIQAGAMREITVPYAAGDGFATIYVDDSYSQWAFGLEIEGDSMMPDYQPGDVVIIEPEWEPRPGDCVAAKNGRQEATFKKYRLRGTTPEGNDIFELVPINDNYPTVRSDETPLVVIGVMAELRRKTRRR